MSLKILQLQKRSSYEYKYIQDKYAFSEKTKCYAIADGTTQSFHSEKWAELITDNFVKNPIFDPKELIADLQNSSREFKEIKVDYSDNLAKASLEKEKARKGATATLVGVKIVDKQLKIISCGDSTVFIIKNDQLITFPFLSSDELDSNSFFLNTERLLNGEVSESFFKTETFNVTPTDIIIIATDALSRLLFKEFESFTSLIEANDFDWFEKFCVGHWEMNLMEEDDISAIIIRDFDVNDIKEILPPKGFTFPKEEEIEFTPSPIIDLPFDELNEADMQEISFKIEQMKEEIKSIKRKYRFHEMLLMIAISLLVLNVLLLFYLRPLQPKANPKEIRQEVNKKNQLPVKGEK
jgi:serine/threonine protein phosphatase PrpC